ncbi:unnamed protein product, partial [Prunus brigantina]
LQVLFCLFFKTQLLSFLPQFSSSLPSVLAVSFKRHNHRSPQAVRPDPIEPPSLPLPIPTKLSRHHRQQPPENAKNRVGFDRFSHRSFSLDSPPNRTSEAPGHQLTRRRDLLKVQQARTSSDRRASVSHHRAESTSSASEIDVGF